MKDKMTPQELDEERKTREARWKKLLEPSLLSKVFHEAASCDLEKRMAEWKYYMTNHPDFVPKNTPKDSPEEDDFSTPG